MFDISLVIQTNLPANSDDIQSIIREFSTISSYVYDTHPDVFILKPVEDKVSIAIDQVHALHSSLSLSPVMGDQKVIVIHPAHALTLPAQQALLKVIEEPPSKVLFVLVTHTPHVLLPTILSRCRVVSHLIQGETVKRSVTRGVQAGQGSEKISYPHNLAEAIKISDEYGAKKDSALKFIQEVIASETDLRVKKAAIKALGQLNKNINAKLVLDQFLFSLI